MTKQTQTDPPQGESQMDKDLQSKPDCPLADFVFKSLPHLFLPSFGGVGVGFGGTGAFICKQMSIH